MKLEKKVFVTSDNSQICYYETTSNSDKPVLLIIHAQGANSSSYRKVVKKLSKNFHLVLIDCYGHGESTHYVGKYNLISQGEDVIELIKAKFNCDINLLGHSSGGLIAAYIASKITGVKNLFLEDAPLFSSVGERRFNAYNYKDLSTVCHNYIAQDESADFSYYYFMNQYCWNFFPKDSREKIRQNLGKWALEYRTKHPDKPLRVPLWPKAFLEAYNGMQNYDPYFGEAFYDDSFNAGVNYEELLSNIDCHTVFMKANTTIGEDGLVQGALTDDDLAKVVSLVKDIEVVRFNSGHGIHNEKPKEFIALINKFSRRD